MRKRFADPKKEANRIIAKREKLKEQATKYWEMRRVIRNGNQQE